MTILSPILIAALSGRALACAANKAGIPAYVVDIFNDEETQASTLACAKINTAGAGFDAEDLIQKIDRLCPPNTAFTYGTGFEHCPDLLTHLAKGRRLYGNSAEVVKQVKEPQHFFPLLKKLAIPAPETQLEKPEQVSGWLTKIIGGAGGYHIHPCSRTEKITQHHYYQKELMGNPHSVLFLANGSEALIIGYNELWANILFDNKPFLYEGAVSVLDMPLQTQLQDAVSALVEHVKLVGLCSMDIVLNATGFHVLEINPRPTITFELHQLHGNLFYWHLEACKGRLPKHLPRPKNLRAHAIVYAQHDLSIPAALKWPAWTADHPIAHTRIHAGQPICTVFAQGKKCQQRVQDRQQQVRHYLKHWTKHHAAGH